MGSLKKNVRRFKLLPAGLLTFACMILVLFLSYYTTQRLMHEQVEGHLRDVSEVISEEAGILFKYRIEELTLAVQLFDEHNADTMVALNNVYTEYNNVHKTPCLFLLRPAGVLVCTNDKYRDAILSADIRVTPSVSLSDVMTIDDLGRVLLITVPVYSGDGVVIGVLGEIIRLDSLAQTINANIYDGQGFANIVDSNGIIVASAMQANEGVQGNNVFDYFKLESDELLATTKDNMLNGVKGSFCYSEDSTGKRHCYYTPVGMNDWFVFVIAPDAVLNDSAARFTAVCVFSSILMVLVFVVFASLIACINRKMLKQISSANEELRVMSEIDSLTGLKNRSTCEKAIDSTLSNMPQGGKAALIILDLDHLKVINDTMGHSCGDAALKCVSQCMTDTFRSSDVVGRLGGDEFLVWLPYVGSDVSLETMMDRLNINVCNRSKVLPDGVNVSISAGIAVAEAGDTFEKLYSYADEALYDAKEFRRGTYKIANREGSQSKPEFFKKDRRVSLGQRHDVQLRNIVFDSLLMGYYSAYLIDIDKDEMYVIKKPPYLEWISTGVSSYTETMRQYINEYVIEKDHRDFLEFTDINRLKEFFSNGEDIVEYDVETSINSKKKWLRCRFTVNKREDGHLQEMLLTFMDITADRMAMIAHDTDKK